MKVFQSVSIFPQVMARTVGEEFVLLDLASGTYFGLDPVGSRIWQLLDEGKTLTEICDLLLVQFDVSREELEHDIVKLVQELEARGLITLNNTLE